METVINLSALAGATLGLYFMLRQPIDKLDRKLDTEIGKLDIKISTLDAKIDDRFSTLDAKIDAVAKDLSEFRSETSKVLARHDERLASLERQRPAFLV